MDSRESSGTHKSTFLGSQAGRLFGTPRPTANGWFTNPESNSTKRSVADASTLATAPSDASSKRGAGVGCSKRACSVAGELPTPTALCSSAWLDNPESMLLLHFGHRMTKGREGTLASSTCRRESHYWQTIIMAVVRIEWRLELVDHA